MILRKSQISIFLIFGLTIVIAMAFIIYLSNSEKRKPLESVEDYLFMEKNSIEKFAQSCLDYVLDVALDELGEKGGYVYRKPGLKLQYTEDYEFTFLYIDRTRFLPELNSMILDVQKYIDENYRYCIDDFVAYEQRKWIVRIPEIRSKVTIGESDVTASLPFPAKFVRNELSFNLGTFNSVSKVRLKKIIREAGNIIQDAESAQLELDSGNEPSGPQSEFVRDGLLFLNYQYPDTGRFLWIIKDKSYEFFFAVNLET